MQLIYNFVNKWLYFFCAMKQCKSFVLICFAKNIVSFIVFSIFIVLPKKNLILSVRNNILIVKTLALTNY